MNKAEVDKFGTSNNGGDCENKTVGKLLSKNLNRAMDYLTPAARQAFT